MIGACTYAAAYKSDRQRVLRVTSVGWRKSDTEMQVIVEYYTLS